MKFLRLLHTARTTALVLSALTLTAAPALATSSNSSTNSATITFSLNSVVYTDSELPVESFLYGFDGEPYDFFSLIQNFVYTQGDGAGSFDGSATLGGITHNYGEPDPDYTGVSIDDDFVVSLNSYGESSTPGSNGSAAANSVIDLPFFNDTDDGFGDAAPITITLDYNYTFSMALVEDAPTGGQGNGFFRVSAMAYLNENPNLDLGEVIQEFYGGPANLVNVPGSGQIVFNIPGGEAYFDLELTTDLNSTTIVPDLHPGDANGDGMVNLADLQILGDNWQSSSATWATADFNGDGNVNLADLQIIGDNWGYGTSPDVSFDEAMAGVVVPEPTSLALLIACVALITRRRSGHLQP